MRRPCLPLPSSFSRRGRLLARKPLRRHVLVPLARRSRRRIPRIRALNLSRDRLAKVAASIEALPRASHGQTLRRGLERVEANACPVKEATGRISTSWQMIRILASPRRVTDPSGRLTRTGQCTRRSLAKDWLMWFVGQSGGHADDSDSSLRGFGRAEQLIFASVGGGAHSR